MIARLRTHLRRLNDWWWEFRHPGAIAYRLYSQDGRLIRMNCRDTQDMRRFREWTRKFDRNTVTKDSP